MKNEFLLKKYEYMVDAMNAIIEYCDYYEVSTGQCEECALHKGDTPDECILGDGRDIPCCWPREYFTRLEGNDILNLLEDIMDWCASHETCDFCPFDTTANGCLLAGFPCEWQEIINDEKEFLKGIVMERGYEKAMLDGIKDVSDGGD